MSTTQRKQREIQQREQQILDVARGMFNEDGYVGLNMDKIAEELQYSKGTIYNHFSCKEEIIIALAIETTTILLKLLQRAAAFSGRSRERMQAIGVAFELFVRLHPDHFLLVQVLRSDYIRQKTSEKRQHVMQTTELRATGIVAGIVRDAISQGDLALSEVAPEDVVFGLWALNYGGFALIMGSDALGDLGMGDPLEVLVNQCHTLLDGYQWCPLTQDHDYNACRHRIWETVFPEEWKVIQHAISPPETT